MRTLLAHEWIEKIGGSENVFEQIVKTIPHSRAACLWNGDPERFGGTEESWLANSPLRRSKAASMPFMQSAWEQVDLADIQRVVVSSHAFAHHLASRAADKGIAAFAYIHTPARYVWVPELDQRGNSILGRLGRRYFQRLDRRRVSDDVSYRTNSQFVRARVAEAWGVDAQVIYPPVDIERIIQFSGSLSIGDESISASLPSEFILGASRLVRYKNLDAAIAAGEILHMPVVIVGSGPDEARLKAIAQHARVPVIFTGQVSDNALLEVYRRAALFVYMPVEDFGIMPVEAMASGTPVLVNEVGGAYESVMSVGYGMATRWTGTRFEHPAIVEDAIRLKPIETRQSLLKFSTTSFQNALRQWVGIL